MQARKTCVYLSLSVSIIKPDKSGSAARTGATADERKAVYVGKLSAWENSIVMLKLGISMPLCRKPISAKIP